MAFSHTNPSLYLNFLRPSALPRPSTLQRFLSTPASASSSNITATFDTTNSSTPIPTPSLIQSSQSTKTSVAAAEPVPQTLPYRITRTPSSNFPIYLLAKRGGNLKQTKLRKIEGDISILRTQLRDALKLQDKDIVINQLTRQIIIRGWRKPEVAKFLEERQF